MRPWQISPNAIPTDLFDGVEIAPAEVLIYYDGPLTFTFHAIGRMFLANMCDEGPGVCRYLVSGTDDEGLGRLKRGEVDMRSALLGSPSYIVDVGNNGAVDRAWMVGPIDVPSDALPEAGVTLYGD